MTIIGFDVSKHELVGARITKRALLQETIVLENTASVITQFLDTAQTAYRHLFIASEATAEYHRLLAEQCVARGIPFRLINPILTKQFTRATIRKQKTDASDALIIAKLALQGEGTCMTKERLDPLRSLHRTTAKVARLERMLTAIQCHITTTFPQEHEFAATITVPLETLRTTIPKLRMALQKRGNPETHTLLQSIPGIGPTIATMFLAEIGHVNQFPSARELVAYAGLDPRVRQSGTSLKRNTKITKRGSPYLRKAAYIAASIAQRHDQELKIYFEKKIKEGKRYKEATVANARKLLARVYAVWKRGTPYVKQEHPSLSTGIA